MELPKTGFRNRVAVSLLAVGLCLAPAVRAESPDAPEPAAPHEDAADANKLAQELANPVANLWSLTFQFNNYQLTNDRWNNNLNFQPVMPVSLTENLTKRPRAPRLAPPISATGRSSSFSRRRTAAAGCSAWARPSSFPPPAPSTPGRESFRWVPPSSLPT